MGDLIPFDLSRRRKRTGDATQGGGGQILAFRRRDGTVSTMDDHEPMILECRDHDRHVVGLADIVRDVFLGVRDPDDYVVSLQAASLRDRTNRPSHGRPRRSSQTRQS